MPDWLRAPSDRDVIARWTSDGPDHLIGIPGTYDAGRFCFLALGDGGDSLAHRRSLSPQDAVARELASEASLDGSKGEGRFVIHLGDVVYMAGERRLYSRNFLKPYAPFVTPESTPQNITFRLPFLPVPGNHDYYDFMPWVAALARSPVVGAGLRALAAELFAYSLPTGGSRMGRAYMEAFVAPRGSPPAAYSPGSWTRLPNRYYRFQAGNADFFALDSNTLDAPPASQGVLRVRAAAARHVRELAARARALDHQLQRDRLALERLVRTAAQGRQDELRARLHALSEAALDAQRELARERRRMGYRPEDFDSDQLQWLDRSLAESESTRSDAWRIVYLHHPIVTSVTNHCERPDVQGVRENLLPLLQGRVDLILAGHSHCFEWIRLAGMPCTGLVITGGGGQPDLRRSVCDPRRYRRYRSQYQMLRAAGCVECVSAGRGPADRDGNGGPVFHFLRVEVTQDVLRVVPLGVRRLASGYRREEPMQVYHARGLPDGPPPWRSRCLRAVEIRRGDPVRAVWE